MEQVDFVAEQDAKNYPSRCLDCRKLLKEPLTRALGRGTICAKKRGYIKPKLVVFAQHAQVFCESLMGAEGGIRALRESNVIITNVPALVLWSPLGFDWGKGSDLDRRRGFAHAILRKAGVLDSGRPRLVDNYAETVLPHLPREGFAVDADSIKDWAGAQLAGGG